MAMLLQALAPALTIAGARQAPAVLALVQPVCSGAGNHASRLVVFEREAAAPDDAAPSQTTLGLHCALCVLPPVLSAAPAAATGPPEVRLSFCPPVDAGLESLWRHPWRHGRPRGPPAAV